MDFEFDADPDLGPDYHSNGDLASQNNADRWRSGSAILDMCEGFIQCMF